MSAIQAQQGLGPGVTGVSDISWNVAPGSGDISPSLPARRAPTGATEMEVSHPLPLCKSPLAPHVLRRAHPWNWAVLVEPETIPACRREI